MPVPAIDLNADVGEGVATAADEVALLELVTSASLCCGAHAGTPESLSAAVSATVSAGTVAGAHPSYPDRLHFGRRPLDMEPGTLARSLAGQLATVADALHGAGAELRYVKPHGALYHRACTDQATARLLCAAAEHAGAPVLLLAAGAVTAAALSAAGLRVAAEGFADRAYLPDGSLAPRQEEGAVILDEAAVVEQALSIALDHRAPALGGRWVEVHADSLCLHGDTPGAARLAAAVRRALEEARVQLVPFAP